MTLKAEGLAAGQQAAGNPQVDVFRAGTDDLVKQVKSGGDPDGSFWLVVEGASSLAIGVYLPSDVDGPVRVTAGLVDGDCRWSGTADKPVDVHSGETASTSVLMKRGACSITTIRDGGMDDAKDGAPTLVADASVDADSSADADSGDAPTLMMKCISYCSVYATACLPNAAYASFACIQTCKNAGWPDGTPAQDSGKNTFACRLDHLKVVSNDAALSCSECFAASPESTGICAPAAPDAGARDACPPTD